MIIFLVRASKKLSEIFLKISPVYLGDYYGEIKVHNLLPINTSEKYPAKNVWLYTKRCKGFLENLNGFSVTVRKTRTVKVSCDGYTQNGFVKRVF